MKKIKISLEYRCFPIWIYDGNCLIDNELPSVLINDKDIELQCIEVQEIFDELYIDNGIEFRYIGFNNINKKTEFFRKIKHIELALHEKVGFEYKIENTVKLENL